MSSGCSQEVKNNEKSINRQPENVVAVAYKRWSFMRGSNSEKTWCLDAAVGGHLWAVVTHGGLTAVLKN